MFFDFTSRMFLFCAGDSVTSLFFKLTWNVDVKRLFIYFMTSQSYGNASGTHLLALQNKGVKIISDDHWQDHVTPYNKSY